MSDRMQRFYCEVMQQRSDALKGKRKSEFSDLKNVVKQEVFPKSARFSVCDSNVICSIN